MKKVYRMKDLDCANCAAKMERGIAKINGVKECSVNFMLQRLSLEIDDSADLATVLGEVKAVVKRVEPDTEIIGL
jgi:copper chaperone CopZ